MKTTTSMIIGLAILTASCAAPTQKRTAGSHSESQPLRATSVAPDLSGVGYTMIEGRKIAQEGQAIWRTLSGN